MGWKMADPAFIPQRGGGGGLWHKVPPTVDGLKEQAWPTHIFQCNRFGDGRPTFALGIYDHQHETFSNMTDPLPVDIGVGVVFGQLSSETPEDSDGADRRVLHASWLSELKGPQSSDCRNTGVITSFRELRFDPRIDRLVENPISEYLRLRKDILFQTTV